MYDINAVMEYVRDNWGSFVSLISLIITVIMVGIAIRRANQARMSANAAEAASIDARGAITRVLTIVDLERAIALVQRLKVLHREAKWEACLEHYPDLRHMLADIQTTYPNPSPEVLAVFKEAIPQITTIENNVDRAVRDVAQPSGVTRFNAILNTIQQNLEEIASSTYFAESEAGS